MKTSRRVDLVAFAAFGLLAAILWFHRLQVDAPNDWHLTAHDSFFFTWPEVMYAWERLQAGEFPLWNPWQMAGIPFSSLQSRGLFHPPNLLLMLVSPSPTMVLAAGAIFHLAVGGFFTWMLGGRLGLSNPARATAALAFMLSWRIFNGFYMPVFLSTMVWLPAVLWATQGLLSRPCTSRAIVLALALGLSFLGGWAQGFLLTVQFALAWGVFGLAVFSEPGSRVRAIGFAALAGLLALGLVAVQLVPAVELALQGSRSLAGLGLRQAGMYAASPQSFLWTVAPVLPLALVPLGLADRPRRKYWFFFLVAALVSALFSLGEATPVFAIYHALPLGNLFRGPGRALFLTVFAIAMLEGIGVQAVMGLLSRLATKSRSARGRHRPILRSASRVLPVLVATAVGLAAYARTGQPWTHPVLAPERPYAPPALLEDLARAPGQRRVFVERLGLRPFVDSRRGLVGLPYKFGTLHGVPVVPDYDPQLPSVYRDYFFGGRPRPLWHGGVSLFRGTRRRPSPGLARLLDLMGVGVWLVPIEPPPNHFGNGRRWRYRREVQRLEQLAGGEALDLGGIRRIERPSALPRVWVVPRVREEPDPIAAQSLLRSGAFDPRETAIVHEPLTLSGSRSTGAHAIDSGSDARSARSARFLEYAPERVVVEGRCDQPRCLLVLSDLDYPGWEATVDGEARPIHRTNVLFRGVVIDRGTHRVAFRYRPRSLLFGASLTAFTLLLLPVLVTCERRRLSRRRTGVQPQEGLRHRRDGRSPKPGLAPPDTPRAH
ncbi:MAG: YfhO family protein [Candidatus Binatia bacterium]|nr:YfhO family protein [Candidatus Binatia bacterium]